jgi:FkbM family methyltransferase
MMRNILALGGGLGVLTGRQRLGAGLGALCVAYLLVWSACSASSKVDIAVYRHPSTDHRLKSTEVLHDCVFTSQGHHFIDQELLYQIGGAVQYPKHNPTDKESVKKAFFSCQDEGFHDNDLKDSKGHGANWGGCDCEVPRDMLGNFHKTGGSPRPRYVEIGADNGRFLSNSFFLDKRLKWEGICVEPSPDTFAQLKMNRPDCHTVNAVVSEGESSFEFYSFGQEKWTRQMSGLKGGNPQTKDWDTAQKYASGAETTVKKNIVPAVTFATLFTKYGFDRIEFMSVDVEGAELIVLSTIDFSKVSVHYIVVEANPPVEPWTKLLLENGFRVMKTGPGKDLLYPNTYDVWFVNDAWVVL